MKKIIAILVLTLISLQAETITIRDKVKVISSEPIYNTITKRIPYEECWDEEIPINHKGSGSNNPNAVGSIIGGAAGGVLGHQVGKGRGNTAATIGGAIIGTMLGNQYIGDGSQNNYQEPYTTYETRKRCTTKYYEDEDRKFIGYKNIAKYKGRTIIKVSRKKLRHIKLNISINY